MSRPKVSATTIIFISILVLFSVMPRYPFICVPNCQRGFRSERGLSIHQSACQPYRLEQEEELMALAQAAEAYHALPPIVPPPLTDTVVRRRIC